MKPRRPRPRGPTRQRQSRSHTRWSEQKRSECEQEPHGHGPGVIGMQATARLEGAQFPTGESRVSGTRDKTVSTTCQEQLLGERRVSHSLLPGDPEEPEPLRPPRP